VVLPSDKRAVVRLRVEGMRCHSCEQVLTAWLSDIRGIEAVLANHANGQVVIYADPDVPVDAMLTAIIRAGFVPGEPTVLTGTDAAAAVEMSIEADRTDIGDVTLILQTGIVPEPASAQSQAVPAAVPEPVAETAAVAELVSEEPDSGESYRRLKLSSQGMHCGACEKLVKANLLQVPGVVAAVGDAADNAATVYLDREVPLEKLAFAVVAAGFTPGRPFVRGMAVVNELPSDEPEPVAIPAAQVGAPVAHVAPAQATEPARAAGVSAAVASASATSAAMAARVAGVAPSVAAPQEASAVGKSEALEGGGSRTVGSAARDWCRGTCCSRGSGGASG